MRRHFFILVLLSGVIAFASFAFAGGPGELSSGRARTFTLDQAILTALQRNPDILRGKQEIERTKGVILEIRAQALPHIDAGATFQWTDPNLGSVSSFMTTGPGITPTPAPNVKAETVSTAQTTSTSNLQQTDKSYSLSITGTQLVFNGTTLPATRGAFFQRDSAYFAFRNALDQVISTVKTQFYQVVVNKALIGVQEESVHLLESQLKDQQNRFEAGTVPRFNVLQAQVALSNQIPQLITARNNYRISQLRTTP